jgi:hypothetical protein
MSSSAENQQQYRLRFLESKKNNNKFSNSDLMGVFVVSSLGLHVLLTLGLGLLSLSFFKLSVKPSPTLVQLGTGESIPVAPLGSKDRTPDVIKKFTADSLSLLMTWSGSVQQGGQTVPDKGVEIQSPTSTRRAKITTPAYQGGFTLSEDFRKEFLLMIGKLTPSNVFAGNTQVVFVPLSISQPVKIEEGKWRIDVVANLNVISQNDLLGTTIPFNKEVFVQAVEAPEYKANADGIVAVVQRVRSSGLEIYAMRDLGEKQVTK